MYWLEKEHKPPKVRLKCLQLFNFGRPLLLFPLPNNAHNVASAATNSGTVSAEFQDTRKVDERGSHIRWIRCRLCELVHV